MDMYNRSAVVLQNETQIINFVRESLEMKMVASVCWYQPMENSDTDDISFKLTI